MSLPIIPEHDGSPQVFYRGTVDREIDLPFNSAVVGDCYMVKETDAFYIYIGDRKWSQIDRGTPSNRMEEYEVSIARKLNKLADHFKRCERV